MAVMHEMQPGDDDMGGGEGAAATPLDWLSLLLGAARRHAFRGVVVFLATMALVVAYYVTKRPVYRVDAKILAQQRQLVPSAVRPAQEDSPARTAWELVHRRENLIALVEQANLLKAGPAPDHAELTDGLRLFARRPQADKDDPLDAMVLLLDKRLAVTSDEGTIEISFEWGDPKQAYRVVDAALQNFIEARHLQEVTAIDEVISVLRVRAARARENLERVSDQVTREYRETSRTAVSVSVPTRPTARGPSEELIRLKSMLESKERAIQDVEEFRRRRLADLQAQYDERKAVLSEQHPAMLSMRQDIAALSKESPQTTQLREEEKRLQAEYQALLQKEGQAAAASAANAPAPVAVRAAGPVTTPDEDERVKDARAQFNQIQERVNDAELELDAVRAAFKYRYNVIWPPQEPREPVSPNPLKIFPGGLLAALALGLLAAAWPDLRKGRILRRWQVEKGLKLPVLAELNRG